MGAAAGEGLEERDAASLWESTGEPSGYCPSVAELRAFGKLAVRFVGRVTSNSWVVLVLVLVLVLCRGIDARHKQSNVLDRPQQPDAWSGVEGPLVRMVQWSSGPNACAHPHSALCHSHMVSPPHVHQASLELSYCVHKYCLPSTVYCLWSTPSSINCQSLYHGTALAYHSG